MPVHLVDHPLVHDALVDLRDATTQIAAFRRAAARLSRLLAVEALRDLPSSSVVVKTLLGPSPGRRASSDVVVVPVLRAGLGMLDAVLELVPSARVGFIGLKRDEATAVASQYYANVPPTMEASYVLLVDPMLATGGSAAAAIDLIKRTGAKAVRMICIVAAPRGVAEIGRRHPDVQIYTPAIDPELNSQNYIVPGLGDSGDRLFGTV